jgi:hypothetical protein
MREIERELSSRSWIPVERTLDAWTAQEGIGLRLWTKRTPVEIEIGL